MSQLHLPHNLPPFAARDISDHYGAPTFDVVFTDPLTWKCYYLDDGMFPTMAEAQEMADDYNKNGWPDDLAMSLMGYDQEG